MCFLWTFFLTLNPHSSSKLLPIIYPSGLSSDTTVSGKPHWLRLPSQDSGSCLIHHHILSTTGPYVTFVLTEGKKQAKDIVSKSVYYTGPSARNGNKFYVCFKSSSGANAES